MTGLVLGNGPTHPGPSHPGPTGPTSPAPKGAQTPARRDPSSNGAAAVATTGGPVTFSLPPTPTLPRFGTGPGNSRPQPQRPIGTPPYGPRKA